MHDTRLLLALCQLLGNPDEFKDVQLYTMVNSFDVTVYMAF